jgi:hypothetical protein
MEQIFSGPAQVSIQGDRALRFLNFTGKEARYSVIGFEDSPVTINDSRAKGLLAIQELMETERTEDFAPKFNHPAWVEISQDETGSTWIELSDTEESPTSMLWIVVGLGNLMPVYDYLYEQLAPLPEEDKYALIAVYQLPTPQRSMLSSMDLSSASSASSLSKWLG